MLIRKKIMTKREKIAEIIVANRECFPDIKKCEGCKYKNAGNYRTYCTTYKIADALIEAGLVADVQSLVDGNSASCVKSKGLMRLEDEE